MKKADYNIQVFVNCPFDREYDPLFRAIIFTILDCGFIPRCSLEINGARLRLNIICGLVKQCKYGIHDLSRVELDARNHLPRFNMPFELGIFYGVKNDEDGLSVKKYCLILEKDRYRYQKFISDLAGIDIESHNNSVKKVICSVRNWLVSSSKRTTIPPGERIYSRFLIFKNSFEKICHLRSISIQNMTFIEFTHNISDWLKINQEISTPFFHYKEI